MVQEKARKYTFYLNETLIEGAKKDLANRGISKYIESLVEKDQKIKKQQEYVEKLVVENARQPKISNVITNYEEEKAYNKLFGLDDYNYLNTDAA